MNLATQKRENRSTSNNTREAAAPAERGFVLPQADIVETKDSFVVTVEMPGVNKEGLEISLENNVLTIIGRRGERGVGGTLLFRESTPRDFRRVFELAPSINTDKVQARITNGVLTLELPKAEKVKPRKITVSA
jgi:HSP20 family protein